MPEEKRILLLNDEPSPPDVRHLLLLKMGYAVREISDPGQIIIEAREFKPHLILIDHSQPARGALAIRMLKGHVLLRSIPIICFLPPEDSGKLPANPGKPPVNSVKPSVNPANPTTDPANPATDPGAIVWLKKPFDIAQFREMTEKLLNRPE
jgi:CheY-like chemotaxis protein